MEAQSSSSSPVLPVVLLTVFLGLVLAFLFSKKPKNQVDDSNQAPPVENVKPGAQKKGPAKKKAVHEPPAEKVHHHPHHHLCLNTIKGHQDAITGIGFSADGTCLATACADRMVRVFKLDDASSKSFKFLRVNLPTGSCPTSVVFGETSSSLVVAARDTSGEYLCLYETATTAKSSGDASKLPPPEVKWEKKRVHDGKGILTLVGNKGSAPVADAPTFVVSCSEATEIKVWDCRNGSLLGTADTNQLRNHMAAVSPDGRFVAAAAFTADVKVWELVGDKSGGVREMAKVMQLKGHKSAVTWLSFSADSSKIVTASKDGTVKLWNINVRYHMSEDPKCLRSFAIPSLFAVGKPPHYDHIALAPGGQILAASIGAHLHWLDMETGNLVDSVEFAHDGDISWLAWSPQKLPSDVGKKFVLASAGLDKKLRLWAAPEV